MRPIRLELCNFGPFSGRHLIDFRELGQACFFLLHGPTGAGKTSILDGVCFALFGRTSGDERDGAQMRSHHASERDTVEVTLDFALGDARYRVTRAPKQQVAKKRGSGTRSVSASASLWRRDGLDHDDRAEGELLETRSSRVTERLEQLLGFDHAQFTQVAMLPQGKFRELLVVKSDQRQAILQTLFSTQRYRRIEEALKAHAKQLRQEVEELRRQRLHVLAQAGVEAEEELRERHSRTAAELADTEERLVQLRRAERAARDALEAGRGEAAKLKEAAEAEAAQRALLAQQAEMKQHRTTLERARRALPLIEIEQTLAERVREVAGAAEQVAQIEARLVAARAQEEEARATLSASKQRLPEQQRLQTERAQLETLVGKAAALERARAQLDVDAAQVEQSDREQQAALAERARVEQEQERANAERQSAQQITSQRGLSDQLLKSARAALDRRDTRDQLDGELARATAALERTGPKLEQLEDEIVRQRAELEHQEQTWASGQAAALATTLVEDQPCPVCGSTQHPLPAHAAQEIPARELIDALRASIQEQEGSRDRLRDQLSRQQVELARLGSKREEIERALGEHAGASRALLESQLADRQQELRQAELAATQVKQLEEQLLELDQARRRGEAELEKADTQTRLAQSQLDKTRAVVEQHEAELPAELRGAGVVQAQQREVDAALTELSHDLERAELRARERGEALVRGQAAREAAGETTRRAQEAAEQQRARLAAAITEAGFEDQDDLAAASLNASEIERLDQLTRAFDAELSSAEQRLTRARELATGLGAPDLEALDRATEETRQRTLESERLQATLTQQGKQLEAWLTELQQIGATLNAQERRYAVAGHVADVACGRVGKKVGFERFVLASLLEEVLDVASRRLRRMSNGRYDLHRARESTDRRSVAGLDLEVSDAYTGLPRSVRTLSGGESFMAALALALGLADVVQRHAGGVRLDTVFIDEGFGSLDAEALDLAVDTLLELQRGGRMVGVISHVPELRERIDTRLELRKGRSGSSARFVTS